MAQQRIRKPVPAADESAVRVAGPSGPRRTLAKTTRIVEAPQSGDMSSRQQDEIERHNEFVRQQIKDLFRVFYVMNGVVLLIALGIYRLEIVMQPATTIFTERVLLAMIGGSIVQLGALAYAIGKGLAVSLPPAPGKPK